MGAGVAPIPAAALSNPMPTSSNGCSRRAAGADAPTADARQIGTRKSGQRHRRSAGPRPQSGIVLVGGHLDSWDLGTGAIDDGAGVAITAAAAKRDHGRRRPARTIRVVWFGAEEVGLLGGNDYRSATPRAARSASESDFGADRIWRVDFALPPRRAV
jgi:hypothetical protein